MLDCVFLPVFFKATKLNFAKMSVTTLLHSHDNLRLANTRFIKSNIDFKDLKWQFHWSIFFSDKMANVGMSPDIPAFK